MRFVLKAALLAATALSASPALAQDEETIVVTATRQPAEADRLPADIDIIDVDTAIVRGQSNLADALTGTPGLNVSRSGGFGQQTSLFSGGSNSNHTLVLLDGIRLNDAASPGSAFDAGQDTLGGLSRIEVVQGPMSALYGSDALGGVINILPRRGGEGPINGRLDVFAGSFGSLGGSAGIDGAVGRLRYAITGDAFVTDGYDLVPERMSTHTGDEDSAESTTLTGVFDYALTDAFSVDLLLRRRDARADYDSFIYPPPTFNEQRIDDPDLEFARNDLSVARIGARWAITDALSLRATTGQVIQERAETDAGVTTSSYDGERRFSDVTADWSRGALSLSAGYEQQNESVDIDQGFATVVASQDHHGGFLVGQYEVDRLTLTGAVRVDDFEGFGAETTWRAGASLQLTENIRAYSAYGTSFRAPTLYERFIYFGNPNLEPERGQAWEVGADARVAAFGRDDGIEIGALYRSLEIEDLIDFDSFFSYANIDRASVESAEARVALRPLSWLTARVSYVYTDAQDEISDTALLRRPQDVWSAAIDIERGALSGHLGWRRVGERADQIYGDDGFSQGVGTTEAYDVLRASVAWSFADGVQAYLAGDNLTDEEYEPVNGFAGAPSNVTIGVRLRN
ncbi:MAG: TonB-dependent receptor [Hyphomonadaceae bacterium]|nr:TonB-dependent receptor [Hyphomonadaceae bacterium]